MSTKALRQMIDDVRQGALPTTGEIAAVEREVEAIKRAAKWMVSESPDPSMAKQHMDLMRAISKEAP